MPKMNLTSPGDTPASSATFAMISPEFSPSSPCSLIVK